ncbi:hypothetical protein AB1Y20_023460 [Prymnesium parvum]|uniref:Beta-catenin-interacting ICAT domain-containing protein n=1 Tax=Prymnesium parvum TaxID=97485 RepID=A0AB34JGX1_PRYPA
MASRPSAVGFGDVTFGNTFDARARRAADSDSDSDSDTDPPPPRAPPPRPSPRVIAAAPPPPPREAQPSPSAPVAASPATPASTPAAAPAPPPAAACEAYRLDVTAQRFGDCTCGWPKSSHPPPRGARASGGGGGAARRSAAAEVAVAEEAAPPAAEVAAACEDYRVDMTAARFGDCKCGLPKAAHGAPPPGGWGSGRASGRASYARPAAGRAGHEEVQKAEMDKAAAERKAAEMKEKAAAEKAAADKEAAEKEATERKVAEKAAAEKAAAEKAKAEKAKAEKAKAEKVAAQKAAHEKMEAERRRKLDEGAESPSSRIAAARVAKEEAAKAQREADSRRMAAAARAAYEEPRVAAAEDSGSAGSAPPRVEVVDAAISTPQAASSLDLALRKNVEDQLERLISQLEDIEGLREELSEEEYQQTKQDTLAQLEEFQVSLEKMMRGNLTLHSELDATRLALRSAISGARRRREIPTPEVIRLFANKQPIALRRRLAEIDRDVKLGKVSFETVSSQASEILVALKKLGEKLSAKEEAFLQKHMSQTLSSFEEVDQGDSVNRLPPNV